MSRKSASSARKLCLFSGLLRIESSSRTTACSQYSTSKRLKMLLRARFVLRYFFITFLVIYLTITSYQLLFHIISYNLESEERLQVTKNSLTYDMDKNPIVQKIEKNSDQKMLQVMSERLERVRLYCSQLNEERKEKRAKVQPFGKYAILLYKPIDVVWCPVYKGGTRTWREYFLKIDPSRSQQQKEELVKRKRNDLIAITLELTEVLNKKSYANLLKQYDLNPLKQEMRGSDKQHLHTFMVVRHPFERLVSAYRDKYEHSESYWKHAPKNDYFYKRHGGKMVAQLREKSVQKFGVEFFSEKNYFGSLFNVTGVYDPNYVRTKDHPCFWEFIQYILMEGNLQADEHWSPFIDHCSVCQVDYNNVIHFENLDIEGEFVKRLFMPNSTTKGVEKLTKAFPSHISNNKLTQLYFNAFLEETDVDRLFDAYLDDFRMFGYSFTFRNKTYV